MTLLAWQVVASRGTIVQVVVVLTTFMIGSVFVALLKFGRKRV